MSTPARGELVRILVSIVCLSLLIATSLWVLKPFLPATIWAIMLVVATWPLFEGIEARLGGRRWLAIVSMLLGMLLLLVIPMWLAIDTILDHSAEIAGLPKKLAEGGFPPPPEWVGKIPVVGTNAKNQWVQFSNHPSALVDKVAPYISEASRWLAGKAGGVGGALLQFLLMVLISGVLYAQGEFASKKVFQFGHRLSGQHGENIFTLAGQAIRAVAVGVGVTALIQTVLAGIGLAVAGVPFASLLSALVLILCIAQIGAMPILLPAAGWMYWSGQTGWAIALIIWALVVGSLDNILRPILIKKGADLPMLLIFVGVIGGMLSMGLIGIFIGPVVLAVTYTLFNAWISETPQNQTLPNP